MDHQDYKWIGIWIPRGTTHLVQVNSPWVICTIGTTAYMDVDSQRNNISGPSEESLGYIPLMQSQYQFIQTKSHTTYFLYHHTIYLQGHRGGNLGSELTDKAYVYRD